MSRNNFEQLEHKISEAIEYILALKNEKETLEVENTRLRTRYSEYEERINTLEETILALREEHESVEDKILRALKQLEKLEDAISEPHTVPTEEDSEAIGSGSVESGEIPEVIDELPPSSASRSMESDVIPEAQAHDRITQITDEDESSFDNEFDDVDVWDDELDVQFEDKIEDEHQTPSPPTNVSAEVFADADNTKNFVNDRSGISSPFNDNDTRKQWNFEEELDEEENREEPEMF